MPLLCTGLHSKCENLGPSSHADPIPTYMQLYVHTIELLLRTMQVYPRCFY